MATINVIIVDDEPRAHKILENYIARMPNLELAGKAYNAVEAEDLLGKIKTDLILLDITMPELDGFALLKKLAKPPYVIFTTAHSEFALESYEYNAVDYLKKPISFERFAKAINKLVQWKVRQMSFDQVATTIDLRIDGCLRTVQLNEILYVKSMGNYVKIFLNNRILVTQVTTSELESKLPQFYFLRIHKSFIVNKSKIEEVNEDELLIGKTRLPVGKTYKKYVREFILARAR